MAPLLQELLRPGEAGLQDEGNRHARRRSRLCSSVCRIRSLGAAVAAAHALARAGRADADSPRVVNVPLPYERFVIETRLTPGQVAERLREVTAPGRRLRLRSSAGGKAFEGTVSDLEFRLTRVIGYRNSFLPVVRGRIEDAPDGARIEVSMRLHPAVFGFMALWFGFLTIILAVIFAIASIRQTFSPFFLVPLGIYAFGYALTTGGFKLESRRSREQLEAMLGAEPAPQATPRSDWTARLLDARWSVDVRWSDVRAAGPLGLAWGALYAVGAALSLYDWMIRHAGCTNQQASDPSYACPSGTRVFTVWAVLVGMMAATAVGLWPILRRRPGWLVPVLLVQIVVIVVLVWIARDPAFHARHR